MARLVAGSGFSLDFDEDRVTGGHVLDAFTLRPTGQGLAAGAGAFTVSRTEAGRWHRTVLDYTGTPSTGGVTARFSALADYDASGALRYRVDGMDATLSSTALDRLGNEVFASIERIEGAGGNDTYYMGIASGRRFDGAGGDDRAIYGADPRRYVRRGGSYQASTPVVLALAPNVYGVVSTEALDILINVETITLDGRTSPIGAVAMDGMAYLASNPDLALAFGADSVAAARHYAGSGRNEGRATASFDPLAYAAGNPDLVAVFGTDAAALTAHYVRSGVREGRNPAAVEPWAYLAAHADLADAFGGDTGAALRHYIAHGRAEGRTTTFNAFSYLSANPDLAAVFGSDRTAAARHYVLHGRFERRPLVPVVRDGMVEAEPDAKFEEKAADARAVVTGTADRDTLSGTLAPDASGALQPQSDTVDGLAGIDTFVLTGAIGLYGFSLDGEGRLVVTGPDGTDTLSNVEFLQATDGLHTVGGRLTVAEPSMAGRTPSPEPTIGDDYLVGNDWRNTIGGNLGNDTIEGLDDNDQLFGHGGNDVLLGQYGGDSLYGAAGNDQLFGGPGNDLLEGDTQETSSNDILDGGSGRDVMSGGKGNDRLFGGSENDTLYGALGNDGLQGGDGDDWLYGDHYTDRYRPMVFAATDALDDELLGGNGNDVLQGGPGGDVMDGGVGTDRFIVANLNESTLAAPDVILGFNGPYVAAAALKGFADYATTGTERDQIDLSEIDANPAAVGENAFTFIGTAGFTAAGQLRYRQAGNVTYIEGTVDSTLAAAFRIQVNITNYQFTVFDFIL